MLLSFCDLCKDTCSTTPTRRWEHIQGELGLEVVILKKDKPVGDTHICDKCVLNMFWVMLERSPNSGIRHQKAALDSREHHCNLRESELLKQRLAIEELQTRLTARQKDVEEKEKLLSDQQGVIDELTKSKTLVDAVIAREKELVRLAELRGKQQAIDAYENPEYTSAMAVREYKRRKGLT